MTTRSFHTRALLCLALLLCAPSALAHSVADELAEAARNFLQSLDAPRREKAVFAFDAAERVNWHFIPRDRLGLPLKAMTPAQRHLAQVLLNTPLSHRGYLKTATIMSLEQILHDLENNSPRRDPELYYFSVFGEPSSSKTWGWRVEGHHLSLNFTLAGGHHISVTPAFFGTNPHHVQSGPRQGLTVLKEEEEVARALVASFTDEQRKTAVFSDRAPQDVITGSDRKARRLEPLGLPMSEMTKPQGEKLWELVQLYVRKYRPEIADAELKKINDAGPAKLFFAWAGPIESGGQYYRIQSDTFLFEYDNTQNNANHVHTVWRDLENDFGDDILRRHYEESPHPAQP